MIVDSGEGWGTGPAKVVVLEPLQNVLPDLKEVSVATSAGTSCYFRLRAGERYVIISGGPPYTVGSCTVSFPLTGNEHILDTMRSYLRDKSPRLVGRVAKRTGRYSNEGGIPGALVELTKGTSRYKALTDADGRYIVSALRPGRYTFQVAKDGYVPDDEYNNPWSGRMAMNPETNRIEPLKDPPNEIEISGASCVTRNFGMWPGGAIRGAVRGLDGQPVEGVPVQAFGFNHLKKLETSPLRTAITNPDGNYTLHPLPAGRYVIGVNARPYHDENPYPPALHAGGGPVFLGEGDTLSGIDLVVHAPRTAAKLRVKAITPDGNPHKGAIVTLENPPGKQRYLSGDKTDSNGELLAPVYVGEHYLVRVSASIDDANGHWTDLEGTAQVNVTGAEHSATVVLTKRKRY